MTVFTIIIETHGSVTLSIVERVIPCGITILSSTVLPQTNYTRVHNKDMPSADKDSKSRIGLRKINGDFA